MLCGVFFGNLVLFVVWDVEMFVEVVNMVIGSNIMLFVSEEWVVFVVYVEV